MFRVLGTILLLAVVFGLGYYAGQRPVSELKRTVMDLSRKVANASRSAVDTTLGLERTLRWRQGIIDAKARVIQAKADLLDHNLGNAAKELAEAEEYVDKANRGEENSDRLSDLKSVNEKIRSVRAELKAGKEVSRHKLDDLQNDLDRLINR